MAQQNPLAAPPPRKGEPLSKRSYTLRLSFSSLVTAGIVLFIGFGWAFVLGVMVGRGYNPEAKMPQLATLLPADEQGPLAQRERLEDSLPKAEVMKPEELRYAATLKGKPGQNATEIKVKPSQNATLMSPVVAPTVLAAGTPGASVVAAADGTLTAATPAGQPPKPQPPAQTQPQFDFVFQVATFKDEGSVDKLRARLEGAGLRSRMDKDGKLLKVMVLMRGSEEAGQQLRQQMVDMNLGQPLQRSKTAVKARKR